MIYRIILTLVFSWLLYSLWKRQSLVHKLPLPLLLCICMLAAGASAITAELLPKPTDQILIEASGERNIAAKNNEIYLTCVRCGDEMVDFNVSGVSRWFWVGSWYVWRNDEDLRRPVDIEDHFTMKLPPGSDRTIEFLTNRSKGIVRIRQGETVLTIDCYSEKDDRLRVSLQDSPMTARITAALIPPIAFAVFFWICILLAAAISYCAIMICMFLQRLTKRKRPEALRKAEQKDVASLGNGKARARPPLFTAKNALPLICIAVLALILAILIHPKVPGPKETAVISAMQYQNTSAKAASVTFTGVTVDGNAAEIGILPLETWWEEAQVYMVHGGDAFPKAVGAKLRISLPVGENRTVDLLKNDASGYAQLEFGNQLWVQDCYSEEDRVVSIHIPDSSPLQLLRSQWIKVLAVSCVFIPLSGVFTLLYYQVVLWIGKKANKL